MSPKIQDDDGVDPLLEHQAYPAMELIARAGALGKPAQELHALIELVESAALGGIQKPQEGMGDML